MRKLLAPLCGLLLLLFVAEQVRADFIIAQAYLDGASVQPNPLPTPGTGFATISLNDAQNQLYFTLTYQNLLSYVQDVEIDIGGPDATGPTLFLLNQGGSGDNQIAGAVTAQQLIADPSDGINTFADAVAAIESGNTYIEIRTPAFYHDPGTNPLFTDVEIRGQFNPVPAPSGFVLAVVGGVTLMGFGWRRRKRAV